MDARPRTGPPDLDHDFEPPPAPVRLRTFDPAEHQRVVVNPFLAVLAALGLWKLTIRLIDGPFPPFFVLAVVGMAALPLLVQYHCLDCGRTGSYPRLGRHACAGVMTRSRLPDAPSSRLPSARGQLILWGWVIGSIGLLCVVVG